MHRKIVVIRPHEWLEEASRRRSFAAAAGRLGETVAVRGLVFDESFAPVPLTGRFAFEGPSASGFDYREARPSRMFCVRTEFESEESIARLRHDRSDEIVGVFSDPVVSICPPYCGRRAIGDASDVTRGLGVAELSRRGLTGRRVRVAVVDSGVDAGTVPVEAGWGPDPGYVPGSAPRGHGTMVAWDVRIAAPEARILDYALLTSDGITWTAFLSDAIAAFSRLLGVLEEEPGPLVVNNSWGMFDRSEDEPIGSPGNYSSNSEHPFNQITGSLVAAGADVLFAAGNCGEDCPDGRCGARDRGPGTSIHGANSHPDVITVAAVTVTDRRLGYSSQGPGGLSRLKPDVAGFSHFRGSGVYPADGGTSAASPVVAGVAAALRQNLGPDRYPPPRLKGLLQQTARDPKGTCWDFDLGYGVVDARAAVRRAGIGGPAGTRRKAKKQPRRRKKR